MPRGKARATYVTDAGPSFWVWVDRDSIADANRGWTLANSAVLTPLGRSVLPRRVVGVDELGHIVYTRTGTTTAPLWQGVATTWTFEGTDRVLHTATRIGRQAEQGPS